MDVLMTVIFIAALYSPFTVSILDVHSDKHTYEHATTTAEGVHKEHGLDREGHIKLYKNLLKVKRKEQLNAVKSIMAMDTKKLKSVLDELISNMQKVLTVAKEKIEKSNFQASSPLLSFDGVTKEAFANVIENTAFFCEIALRFPSVAAKKYWNDYNWRNVFDWSYRLSAAADLYDESGKKLLNLAGQQLNIIPREENFVNPYDKKYQKEQLEREAVRRMEEAKEKKQAEKKLERKKKKINKPSLSHTEL